MEDGGVCSPRFSRTLRALSTPARRTFELRGIYRHAVGMMMAFGSPYSGNWLIFADLDVSDSAAPRLSDIVAVDLGRLE